MQKFNTISQSIYKDFAKGERLIALNSPLLQFCMYLCMILISWFGARAIVASGNNAVMGLTTGDLTALITYATQILMSLMMLSMIFAMLTIARSSAERIAELLRETTDIQNVDFTYASKAEKRSSTTPVSRSDQGKQWELSAAPVLPKALWSN